MTDEPHADPTDLPASAPWWAHWLQASWRSAWKWFTVQGVALRGAAPLLYEYVPTLQAYFSETFLHNTMGVLALLVIVGHLRNKVPANDRSVQQPPPRQGTPGDRA